MTRFERRVQLHLSLFRELGRELTPQTEMLDFGCGGAGELVKAYRERGYAHVYGCSMGFRGFPEVRAMREAGILRLIDHEPYRVPFADNTFDVIISDQVFEHVFDYDAALAEIKRLLKPGGTSFHIFVSRCRPLEAHTGVPFGAVLRWWWWYWVWVHVHPRRTPDVVGGRGALARRHYAYVQRETHYLPKHAIRAHFRAHFPDAQFCEGLFLTSHPRLRTIAPLLRRVPWLAAGFSTIHSRVVLCMKDKS